MSDRRPVLRAVVIDATEGRKVAEFYRELLGYHYRAGDEPPPAGGADPHGDDWLVLIDSQNRARLAIQHVDELPASTWPQPSVPQQLHLDMTVADIDELTTTVARARALGAGLLEDRSGDPAEPLFVLADPAGHPFCIFVSPDHPAEAAVADAARRA